MHDALRLLAAMFISVACFSSTVSNEPDQMSRFAKLTFSPDPRVSERERSQIEALMQLVELVPAYEPGIQAVRTYKDPVLTRGTRGITLFRQASPGVVLVTVGKVVNEQFQPEGLGTGAVIDSRGYVITNWHVVNGYSGALVFLKPLGAAEPTNDLALIGKVIAQDETRDLALLRLINPSKPFTVLPVSTSNVDVAEDVHIIGHPKGHFWSYSTGVISQYRRAYDWSYEDGSKHRANVLQMQTAVNPGNSGGPVLDDAGQIIGLVAWGENGQNLNYAISADEIRGFLSQNMPVTAVRTRGAQASTTKSIAPVVHLSEALSDEGERIIRAQMGATTIYVEPLGQSWEAVGQTGTSTEIHIRPKSENVWSVTSPITLTAELQGGSLTRIRGR